MQVAGLSWGFGSALPKGMQMLNQDALRLALAVSRESNHLRAAVELVESGAVSASDAFQVLAQGANKYRQAEALSVLYHWAAPVSQRRALVAAGQRIGLDLQPLVSLRKRDSEMEIWNASKFGPRFIPEYLMIPWFLTHPKMEFRDSIERGMGAHLRWWHN